MSDKPGKALWHGGVVEIPRSVVVCPECGGSLEAECIGWDPDTGQPDEIAIACCGDDDRLHRWWQSDWQEVRDRIAAWAGAYEHDSAGPSPKRADGGAYIELDENTD